MPFGVRCVPDGRDVPGACSGVLVWKRSLALACRSCGGSGWYGCAFGLPDCHSRTCVLVRSVRRPVRHAGFPWLGVWRASWVCVVV